MKKFILLTLFSITIFASCKKDDDPTMMGVWTIDRTVVNEYVNNALVGTDTDLGDGTTLDFQSGGNMIVRSPGFPDETLPYTLLPNNKINIDGEILDIQNLENSSVTLYYKDDYGGGDYDDVFIYLRR